MRTVEEILAGIRNTSPFGSVDYPYPVNQSLFGSFDLESLRHKAACIDERTLIQHLGTILALSEAFEACQPDRSNYFISDREVRARLNALNNDTGWALVWDEQDERTLELAHLLYRERFQIYLLARNELHETLQSQRLPHVYLGDRPTSVVYFAQAILRYSHIYGRIMLGDVHETTHFIEDHGPGVLVLSKETLTPLEEFLALAIMSLGVPGVVPSTFTQPYGNTKRADGPAEILAGALEFDNLKVRAKIHLTVDLPFNFDFVHSFEKIEAGMSIGGTPLSSFIVTNEDHGDGIEVVGGIGPDVAIQISAGDPVVDISTTSYLETVAARLPGYIQGVSCTVTGRVPDYIYGKSAELHGGCPTITWRPDIALKPEYIAQAIYQGLKAEFKLKYLKVRLVFDRQLVEQMKKRTTSFRRKRNRAIAEASEENESYFYGCTRCHSFALEHACTVTPDRPPQCGKTWMHIKTRAFLSDFTSAGEVGPRAATAPDTLEEKGVCLDPLRGEYAGINSSTERYTGGRVKRVFLHSLFGHPHTGCSCYGVIAFYIPEVDGVGLIDRAYKGVTPDGKTWDTIANAAAGKQVSGLMTMSSEYLQSRKFLQGDGGWARVVWMPKALKQRFAATKGWIGTEKEASSMDELKSFVKASKGQAG